METLSQTRTRSTRGPAVVWTFAEIPVRQRLYRDNDLYVTAIRSIGIGIGIGSEAPSYRDAGHG